MSDFEQVTYGLAAVLAIFGAFVTAFLHGLGFSVFGLKQFRPGYWRRYTQSVLAFLLSAGLNYAWLLAFTKIILSGSENSMQFGLLVNKIVLSGNFYFLSILFMAGIFHFSLGIVAFFTFESKKNLKAAILSPLIVTALYVISMAFMLKGYGL